MEMVLVVVVVVVVACRLYLVVLLELGRVLLALVVSESVLGGMQDVVAFLLLF